MYINKKTLSIARLLHVYVSMTLFSLLVFFSITGVTLNHPEWFKNNTPHVIEKELSIPLQSNETSSLDQETIKHLTNKIEQVLSISLADAQSELMTDELFFEIKSAGQATSISLNIQSGELFYQYIHYGIWAQLNDLHKGRNTSVFWQWVIDITSVLFIVFAITGFILAMPQRRFLKTFSISILFTVLMTFTTFYFS